MVTALTKSCSHEQYAAFTLLLDINNILILRFCSFIRCEDVTQISDQQVWRKILYEQAQI